MTPAELRAIVLSLPARQPITDAFEAEHRQTDWSAGNQRQHLDGWLAGYNTPGAYNRSRLDGDARDFYQRFRCVGGLVWLAEALGVDGALLESAIVDVVSAGTNPSRPMRRVPAAGAVEDDRATRSRAADGAAQTEPVICGDQQTPEVTDLQLAPCLAISPFQPVRNCGTGGPASEPCSTDK